MPADQLLVFSVKEGWEPLCEFLGKPVPEEPFPVRWRVSYRLPQRSRRCAAAQRINSTKQFAAHRRAGMIRFYGVPLAVITVTAVGIAAAVRHFRN